MCSNASWSNCQFLPKTEFLGIFSNIEIWGQNRPLHPWNPYLMLDFLETCVQCASCGDLMFLEKNCNFCQKIKFYTYGFLQWPPGTSSGIQAIPRGPPLDLRGPPVGPWGPPVETSGPLYCLSWIKCVPVM